MYYTGNWKLSDLNAGTIGLPKNKLRVFSCFSCGGGSSMGYRLAGYTVEGFCEIDKRMAGCYLANMRVEHPYVMPIAEFNEMIAKDLPPWLRNIDVLDGSPPCSSFSMSGSRDRDWGKKKMFKEGQSEQVLDDLFFHFIRTAEIVRPNAVVAENVKGMLIGDARKYVAEIFLRFNEIGYDAKLFLMNAATMGVPQRRERVFFIATKRSSSGGATVNMNFSEPRIPVSLAFVGVSPDGAKPLSKRAEVLWRRTYPGDSFSRANDGSWFNWTRLKSDRPSPTMPATCRITHHDEPRFLSDQEACAVQSFPLDYRFCGQDARYICGMSVPPLMMQRISGELAKALSSTRPTSGRSPRSSRSGARA